MKTLKIHIYLVLTSLALLIYGCTPFGKVSFVQLDGSSIAINSDTFKSYDFIGLDIDHSTNPVTVRANQVPAGRIWDFGMVEKNVAVSCIPRADISPSMMSAFNSAIHIDIGPQKVDGTYIFDCKANSTNFTFEVNYKANRSQLISSNLFKTPYLESKEKAKVSSDGKKVVYVSYGQVYLKDLATDSIYLISSPNGAIGNQANADATSAQMSSDGTKVVFQSAATNLISGATGTQIYLKNLTTNTLSLVSSTDGTSVNQANGTSTLPQINAQGNKVIFQSAATNLVSGSSGQQIFMKDLTSGTITLLSSTDGTTGNQGNGSSSAASISSNGLFVSFTSAATNLIGGGTTGTQVFSKNITTGEIKLASSSHNTTTTSGNNTSDSSSISDDGNLVVFQSTATNLSATTSANKQVFLKNFSDNSVKLLSSTDSTVTNQGNNESTEPVISNDGLKVVFTSKATNLIAATAFEQVYLKNLSNDSLTLISSSDGTSLTAANALSIYPNLSKDAAYMVFKSESSNLVPGAIGSLIYLKNLSTGAISAVSSSGQQSVVQGNGSSWDPQLSSDGEKIVFYSSATNLVDNIPNAKEQVYVKNLKTGIVTLVSSSDGTAANAGNDFSYLNRMTPDAKKVVFVSRATNLIPGVSGYQIYMKNLETGVLSLISSHDGTAGNAGNSYSLYPTISDDGNRVAFYSAATNLVNGQTMSGYQMYVKDIPSGTLFLVSNQVSNGGGQNAPSNNAYFATDWPGQISADGTKVAFALNATNVWPGASGVQIYVAELTSGNTVSSIYFASSNSKYSGAQRGNNYSWSPKFSGDGNKVVFFSWATNFVSGVSSGVTQVYMKNLTTEAVQLVSSLDGTGANRGNNSSYIPSVSYDGNLVSFQSRATNLMSGVVLPSGSNQTHVYIKNMTTGSITMASSKDGTAATQGNVESGRSNISSDGKKVIYGTSSTNLVPNATGFQIYLFDNE